jgi:hypothetical protein
MSYALSTFVNCPTLQEGLDNFFGCDYTKTLKNNEVSLLKTLLSPANSGGVLDKIVSPGQGKLKTIELVYTPRIPNGAVGTTIDPNDCTATEKFGDRSETYTIDPLVGVSISRIIDPMDLIQRCESDSNYFARLLYAMMDSLVRRMDKISADQIIAFAGAFGQNETNVSNGTKTVKTRTSTSDSRLVSNWISDIEFAADNAGYCTSPLVFAYNDVYKVAQELRASNCCNDGGMNLATLASLSGMMFIPNRNVPSALGGLDRFITVDPGKVQLLTYNKYGQGDNIQLVDDAAYKATTINHAETGLDFDFRMVMSCGKWHIFVELAHKLVGIPDDVYEVEDIYSGVTGVNKYAVNNA